MSDSHQCPRCLRSRDPENPAEAARCWWCQSEEAPVEREPVSGVIDADPLPTVAGLSRIHRCDDPYCQRCHATGHSGLTLRCPACKGQKLDPIPAENGGYISALRCRDCSWEGRMMMAASDEEAAIHGRNICDNHPFPLNVVTGAELRARGADAEEWLFRRWDGLLKRLSDQPPLPIAQCACGCHRGKFAGLLDGSGATGDECGHADKIPPDVETAGMIDADPLPSVESGTTAEKLPIQYVNVYAQIGTVEGGWSTLRFVANVRYEDWLAGKPLPHRNPLSWGAPLVDNEKP